LKETGFEPGRQACHQTNVTAGLYDCFWRFVVHSEYNVDLLKKLQLDFGVS